MIDVAVGRQLAHETIKLGELDYRRRYAKGLRLAGPHDKFGRFAVEAAQPDGIGEIDPLADGREPSHEFLLAENPRVRVDHDITVLEHGHAAFSMSVTISSSSGP